MGNIISVKHSYNAGDLITILPGLNHLHKVRGDKFRIYQRLNLGAFYYDGAVHPVQHDGQNVCQNEETFRMLKPLIEYQDYIESFRIWEGEAVDIDIDKTRDSKAISMPYGDIHYWATLLIPELACDLSKDWLKIEVVHRVSSKYMSNKIIINLTERYRNPYITYYFLKEHEDKLIFAGTLKEHDLFCFQYKLKIPLLKVESFLDLAFYIKNCMFFLGNQSFCWHLADATHHYRILEYCPQFPNTFPTGANGFVFSHQMALQVYFKQLLNR